MTDLDKIFDDLEDNTTVEPYHNSRFVGFEIRFSIKGFGFGGMTLSYDKEKEVYKADVEAMSEEMVEEILIMAAPQLAKLMCQLDETPMSEGKV